MTFRNKEGHVTFQKHEFDDSNYKEIAETIEAFYAEAFGEKLSFKISMKPNEKHIFRFYK